MNTMIKYTVRYIDALYDGEDWNWNDSSIIGHFECKPVNSTNAFKRFLRARGTSHSEQNCHCRQYQ